MEGLVFPLTEDVQVTDGRLLDLAVGEDSPAHRYGVLISEVGDDITLLVNRGVRERWFGLKLVDKEV